MATRAPPRSQGSSGSLIDADDADAFMENEPAEAKDQFREWLNSLDGADTSEPPARPALVAENRSSDQAAKTSPPEPLRSSGATSEPCSGENPKLCPVCKRSSSCSLNGS